MFSTEYDMPGEVLPTRVTGLKCVKANQADLTDIVEKFIKVAHGADGIENNRARENARENIRKKLALEAGREKVDGCDLQVRLTIRLDFSSFFKQFRFVL